MPLTAQQQDAVAARGNVLVVAGAGTGKTKTLVERCLHCLLNEEKPVSIDEVLMVTFTEKAAAEVRERIRERIEQHADEQKSSANILHWAEQLALFESAHIGTLHSFCFRLVQQNFYTLKLDPQLAILSAEEAALHARDALDEVLQRHYSAKAENAEAVQNLIRVQGHGSDLLIRKLVLQLHHYTQTLPDPKRWLENELEKFSSQKPTHWESWFSAGVVEWIKDWLAQLNAIREQNPVATIVARALEKLPPQPSRADCASALAQISSVKAKSDDMKPLRKFFKDAAFLDSLAQASDEIDPLAEDWNWIRDQMIALLTLVREFGDEFSRTKRELGAVDFHDLEQFAIDLLWDREGNKPTALARQWREKLRYVFVDEYQDINAAQDKIIVALGGEEKGMNRFLVGDPKQSIYRFRLADPKIFRDYIKRWNGADGKVFPLADNFRSQEKILQFANSVFTALMREEIGGIAYDKTAALQFGARDERQQLSCSADPRPRVELHLRIKGAGEANPFEDSEHESTDDDGSTLADLASAEAEAHIIATRLRQLKNERHQVWDDKKKMFRDVDYGDMAILLRAPSGKADSFAKQFQRADVPLTVVRAGFYESIEVKDLLNLLSLLDNPLQDLPVLAVLRSPLVGLTNEELARVRLALPRGNFWHAVQRFHEEKDSTPKFTERRKNENSVNPATDPTWRKIDLFLERFRNWRKLARQGSLSRCLETVLNETSYPSWILAQPRGRQRSANIERFLALAQRFDTFQRQGLFRFLKFIEAQQLAEAEPDFPTIAAENAVRLMSIHQSKGLEFPVVVVADLGKNFNEQDLQGELILDEEFGLCPHVRPPHTGRIYPSLPYWLAKRRQKKEMWGEEMRLLYVATTRARDTLILSGTVTAKKVQRWNEGGEISAASLLDAKSFADWMGLWFAKSNIAIKLDANSGENHLLRWFLYSGAEPQSVQEENNAARVPGLFETDDWENVQRRLSQKYEHESATNERAKTSVTDLRRRYTEEEELVTPFMRQFQRKSFSTAAFDSKISATERGSAHHIFLQFVSLEKAASAEDLKREATRLEGEGVMTRQQIESLDFAALTEFWQSGLGSRIRANADCARREVAFTSRFSPNDLAKLVGAKLDASLEREFVIVQGAADLVVILRDEIWLVDFKTDEVTPGEVEKKKAIYEAQLLIYAAALERIYKKRVTEVWLHFLALQKSERIAT